jgi:polysaccharide biosynthesis transport protein
MQDVVPRADQDPAGGGGRQLTPAAPGSTALMRDPYAPLGYGQAPPTDTTDFFNNVMRAVRVVTKRKFLILGVAILGVTIGAVQTLLRTPIYVSTVQVQIDREAAKVIEGGATSSMDANSNDFLRTQYELLKSRAISERVVSALQLGDDKEFLKPRDVALTSLLRGVLVEGPPVAEPPAAARESTAVAIVSKNITVRPVPGSRLIDLSFADPNPRRAERIANAYADAFVASTLDKRFQANASARTFLEDQLKQMKLRLEESEKVLIEFAETEKIIEVSDKASIAESNLQAANTALGVLVSERIKNEQSWNQVQNATGINLPQLLLNSVVDGLRTRRNALATEYEEKLETFKPSYPAMVQISNKIKEIDRQLAVEVKAIKSSLKAAFDASASQEQEMIARIADLRNEVLELQKKAIRSNILKREVESNRGLYNSLLQRFKEVDIAGGVTANNVFIVDRALEPGAPSEPRLSRALILSLAVGMGLGLGLAFLLDALDNRIRLPEEVEQLSALPTLGIIPVVKGDGDFQKHLGDPSSAVAEAYRSLATALQFSSANGLPRSLSITSTGPGEGKSSTALALARHFAMLGQKVLLVDADLRKPSLHDKLGQSNAVGLTNYLTGAASPPDVIQATSFANLAFIPSGPLPPNAADILSGTRMYSLISVGKEVFDLIVVDAPPMLGIADAQLIANATSATVFVVGAGQCGRGAIQAALRRLSLARCTVIGCVLTKFSASAMGYGYGYGDQYSYSYGANVRTNGQVDTRQLSKADA